jgi:Type II secretory pathway, pseudopilin PulG
MFMKKRAAFSLSEIAIIMMIIGILAGITYIAIGSQIEKAEAARYLSELDTVRAGLLAHKFGNLSRTEDPLVALANRPLENQRQEIESMLEKPLYQGLRNNLVVSFDVRSRRVSVGFTGLQVSGSVEKKLQHMIGKSSQGFTWNSSKGDLSLVVR